MASPDRDRKERDDTDAKLLAERAKTDSKLAEQRTSNEQDADDVIDVARERAEATLREARDLADRRAPEDAVPPHLRRARAVEDGAIAVEQSVADARLRAERGQRKRELSALLQLERQATDDGLLVERARADEVVATRDEFLAIVSHDLRSMVGGISLSGSMVAKLANVPEGEDWAKVLKHAERIQRFGTRMTRLVGDLVDVVSLEAGKLHVTRTEEDATALVNDAYEAFQPSFVAKGVALTISEIQPVFATLDHDRIFQVLANLLGNALKFTQAGGAVEVSVAKVGNDARFSVSDDGIGVPAEKMEEIFERFRQVTRNDRRGLGLGLYIAKCIVDAHDGSIWAERSDTGGLVVHVTLPGATAQPTVPPP